jgi:SpoVK/Ycf46/Vps4 family AAA+-type ATPase
VSLRNDNYSLHYDMVGGLDKQIKEIKEVVELPIKHPELFESLGIAQPKVHYNKDFFPEMMCIAHYYSIIFMRVCV